MQRIKKSSRLAVFLITFSCLTLGLGCSHGTPSSSSNPSKTKHPSVSKENLDSRKSSIFRAKTGTKGMVVTVDPIAAEWGAEVLRRGGNAIDAAVATVFALSVTRPMYASIGGGGFLLFCPKTKRSKKQDCKMIDFREAAPKAATKDLFSSRFRSQANASKIGSLASGVPGMVAGLLMAQSKWGKTPRKKLLSKPIALARKGFPMSGWAEQAARNKWNSFNPAAKKALSCHQFGKKNSHSSLQPCEPGGRIIQKDLAKVLSEISNKGTKGFYRGWVGERIAKYMENNGGLITLKDLRRYNAKVRSPLTKVFKGMEVVTSSPPSAGGANLIQLLTYSEFAEKMGLFNGGHSDTLTLHAQTHAMALSFADRAHYFGDRDYANYPLDQLISENYLKNRWNQTFQRSSAQIPSKAGEVYANQASRPTRIPIEGETTHVSVIDENRNAVSVTISLNGFYGSGVVIPGTGVFMNNHMDDFVTHPGEANLFGLVGSEANTIEGGKRPLSSMSPTIVRTTDGHARFVLGAAGGPKITTGVYQILMNRLQFHLSLPDAVIAPRIHHQWRPATLMLEKNRVPRLTKDSLEDLGYLTAEKLHVGRAQVIEVYQDGEVWGISDPRDEGSVAVQ